MNDVLLNKAATIQRCLQRIAEEFGDEAEFRNNFTRQDSVLLNLQRCCEASIDMANHLIRQRSLGIPQSSRDSFALLATHKLIEPALATHLQKMVGLRNIAVHDDQALNLDIVIYVLRQHLDDFTQFSRQVLALTP